MADPNDHYETFDGWKSRALEAESKIAAMAADVQRVADDALRIHAIDTEHRLTLTKERDEALALLARGAELFHGDDVALKAARADNAELRDACICCQEVLDKVALSCSCGTFAALAEQAKSVIANAMKASE